MVRSGGEDHAAAFDSSRSPHHAGDDRPGGDGGGVGCLTVKIEAEVIFGAGRGDLRASAGLVWGSGWDRGTSVVP